jgi:GntR family transcriptional regulator, transcriptional repressor for pyruvate dehydrogenase complex
MQSAHTRNRRHVYEVVLLEVRRRIKQRELTPGTRLPTVAALSRQYGVSQGSVREALRILQSQGVIRIEHGRGLFVADRPGELETNLPAPAPPASLQTLQEARAIIEPELAALAAQRANEEDVDMIAGSATRLGKALAEGNRAAYLEADLLFHQHVARASGNPVLERMLDAVHDLLVDSRRRMMDIPSSSQKAVHFHALIATAIRQRNPVQARTIMQAHLQDVLQDVQDAVPAVHGPSPGMQHSIECASCADAPIISGSHASV